MIVRVATPEDVFRILDMSRLFWSLTGHDVAFDSDTAGNVALTAIDQRLAAVLEVDDEVVGFAVGAKFPCLANRKVTWGQEVAWWVEEDHRNHANGRSLLEFLEILAAEAGITKWSMICMEKPDPAPAIKLYERHGYELGERTYMKEIGWQR